MAELGARMAQGTPQAAALNFRLVSVAPDGAAVQALAEAVRSVIDANLLQMTAARRSVWLG